MDPLALPKRYYATETKPLHLIGYTLALGLMVTGALETLHSIPYVIRGESTPIGMTLGPATILLSGFIAGGYLMEAGINPTYEIAFQDGSVAGGPAQYEPGTVRSAEDRFASGRRLVSSVRDFVSSDVGMTLLGICVLGGIYTLGRRSKGL